MLLLHHADNNKDQLTLKSTSEMCFSEDIRYSKRMTKQCQVKVLVVFPVGLPYQLEGQFILYSINKLTS